MKLPVDIIGIGADGEAGLRPEAVQRILAADALIGGERQLSYFPKAPGKQFPFKKNTASVLQALQEQLKANARIVVLASGDPYFYGIAGFLTSIIGREHVRVEPTVSSMQLAFARAGVPWDEADLASIHGRDRRAHLLPLLGRPVIGLFTHDGDSPAAVARFFLDRGAGFYEACVGENLGSPQERFTRWARLTDLLEQRFDPLNYLILVRAKDAVASPEVLANRGLVPGVPDDRFARAADGPEVMTRQEVRSVLLAKCRLPGERGAAIWDVGAGTGSVAVECAVLRPQAEVVAVEQAPDRVALLQENRGRFDAYNVRVVAGQAPAALEGETIPPQLVFIGGSGGLLLEILQFVRGRLVDGGRLVANFVTLEHLAQTLQLLRDWRWPVEVSEVHVSRSDPLAGLTGLKPQRGVFIVAADKPKSING